ncbi:MAG TPA: Na+/H+ antiporter [Verrucomicrobiae bacterium]|nr:Na+/H+ antiporter [Verrucomicrobiae bacterium]
MSTADIIKFLLWLLIAASFIALLTKQLKVPYTVALVAGGFAIDLFRGPITRILGPGIGSQLFTPDIILILFLPALLFESSVNINVRQLRENLAPILLLAIIGVLIATVITGYALHWVLGVALLPALLFGALISATDPISVVALFKDLGVSRRLSVIVESESLLNDGTSVVIFQIVLAALASGDVSLLSGIRSFCVVTLGGAAVGLGLGYLFGKATKRVDDPQIEITLTMILAYSSYLIAEHFGVSGVIATVAAGIMTGNYGLEVGMSARTRVALRSFWECVSFVINSVVFLLIGMEVHLSKLAESWRAILLAIGTVVLGRAVSVYLVGPVSRLSGSVIPLRWQHVLVWGGLHGSVSMALALGLPHTVPHRPEILAMAFGVVAFSIVVQGLTVKPLLRLLRIEARREGEYEVAKVRSAALSACRQELDGLIRDQLISESVYERLRQEVDDQVGQAKAAIASMQERNRDIAYEEMRMARLRLLAAEKSSIQRSANQGLISTHMAEKLLAEADTRLDRETRRREKRTSATADK